MLRFNLFIPFSCSFVYITLHSFVLFLCFALLHLPVLSFVVGLQNNLTLNTSALSGGLSAANAGLCQKHSTDTLEHTL